MERGWPFPPSTDIATEKVRGLRGEDRGKLILVHPCQTTSMVERELRVHPRQASARKAYGKREALAGEFKAFLCEEK
jgi:hypothetical protein